MLLRLAVAISTWARPTSSVSLRGCAFSSSSNACAAAACASCCATMRALDAVIDDEDRRPSADRLSLRDQDLGDRARHLWVEVHVLAVRLIALDDSVGVDPLAVRVRGGIEGGRQRVLGPARRRRR